MVAAHLAQRALDADVEPERDEPATRCRERHHPVGSLEDAAGGGVPVGREAERDPVAAAAREDERDARLRELEHARGAGYERARPRHAVDRRVRAIEDRRQPRAAAREQGGLAA